MGRGGIRISDEPSQKKARKTMSHEDCLDKYKNVKKNPETELFVGILSASDIDKNTKDPAGNRRIYYVHGWVTPDKSFRTYETGTLPNPEWDDEVHKLYSGQLNSGMFLYIEVYRCHSIFGAVTSSGSALVGRGRLSVPKKFMRRGVVKRCGLVTPEGSAAGFAYIELMLRKI